MHRGTHYVLGDEASFFLSQSPVLFSLADSFPKSVCVCVCLCLKKMVAEKMCELKSQTQNLASSE